MSNQKMKPAFVDPRWTAPLEPFDEHYDRLIGVAYSLRDPQPKIKDIGSRSNKRCAFCGKAEPETSFKIDAHLLPESLGNRHYVSNEECDICNVKHGQLYEDELGKMLHLERAIQRVRTKDGGTAKLKSPTGNSYIGGGSFDAPLQIHYDKQDPFLRCEYEEKDVMKLTVSITPSFRPIQALRSILKSFWLAIDPGKRSRFEFVRKFINGSINITPTEIMTYFQSEGADAVFLEAWHREEASNLPTSELVVRLTFSHFVILWCAPDSNTLQHQPSLLPPPLFMPSEDTIIQTKVYVAHDPDEQTTIRDINYTFSYGSRTQTEDAGADSKSELITIPTRKRPVRPVFKVKVEIIGSKENSYIEETYMTEFRADERNHRYQLQSGTAAASILLHEDRLTEKTRLEVKKQLHLCNAENGYLAMKCLRILFTGKCTLRITNLDTGELLKDFPIEGASSQENYQALEDFCKFIVRINENFKLDLRIPNPPCQLPFITAAWIYHGIVYGEIERRSKEPIKWTVSAAHARSVLNALRTGEEITFEDPAHTVELLGAQINLGLMRGRFVNPQLVDSLEELAKKIESLPDEEEVELAILCDSIVDVFPVGPLPPAQR